MLNYCISVNNAFKIVPMAGVMPSLGLTGVTKRAVGINGTSYEYGDPSDWYADGSLDKKNRFNLYAVVGLDLRYSGFNIFGGYRFGLLDVDPSEYVSLKTNGMFVGIGWTL